MSDTSASKTLTKGSNVRSDLSESYLRAAANGEIKIIEGMVGFFKSVSVDTRNEHGWTALMLAARNGHSDTVKYLLDKGADPGQTNKSGQTAIEIAAFWNHGGVVKTIQEFLKPSALPQLEFVNHFGTNSIDRQSYGRKNTEYIKSLKTLESTRYLVFADLELLTTSKDRKLKTLFLSASELKGVLETADYDLIYVGKGCNTKDSNETSSGNEEDIAYFALSLKGSSSDYEDLAKQFGGEFAGKGYSRALMTLSPQEAGMVAQSRSILAWHDRYQFCPTCGSPTEMKESGYKRSCLKKECRSHQGVHNTCFPRIDPVVIVLVVSPDNKKCLLGRQSRFPPNMYSCLAGFMEPGESMEDAARREVLEESGVKVGRLEYHSSQPWPFPGQLMIGFIGHAISEEIIVDQEELEDAKWFTRAEVAEALVGGFERKDGGLIVPPKYAIAHQLQKSWVKLSANL